jgi:hypothetical protein
MCGENYLDFLNTQVEIHSDVRKTEYNPDSNIRYERTASTEKSDDVLYRCHSVKTHLSSSKR